MATQLFRKTINSIAATNTNKTVKKALVPMLFAQNMSSQRTNKSDATAPATQNLTKNLKLHLCRDAAAADDKRGRPLAVIFSWLMAKPKHVMKFGDFYKEQGFDVLTVDVSPMQLLWPVKGCQVVADDVLEFLTRRHDYGSIVVHGFSIGGYVYGEVLVKIKADAGGKYGALRERIVGQVFDSAVDVEGIQVGLPKAITGNVLVRKAMEAYVGYHMRTFHDVATRHYLRSSDHFHNNCVPAPGLFLFSRDDPVGTPEGNMRVIKRWEEMGRKVYIKCWESSPHVSHLHHHREEYLDELAAFLDRLDLLRVPLDKTKTVKKASKL